MTSRRVWAGQRVEGWKDYKRVAVAEVGQAEIVWLVYSGSVLVQEEGKLSQALL